MALVYQNGRPYYYKNKRQNGKVVRQYVASGLLAEFAAEQDARRRDLQQARRAAAEEKRMAFVAARATLLDLLSEAELLINATLLDAGYHRQNRGPWRRRTK